MARSRRPTDRPGDERPFAGVPIAIKDHTPVEGLPMTFGSMFLADYRRRPQRLPRAAAAGGRVRDRRHHQHARVRHPADHRAAPAARPATRGTRADAGRLLGRRGGGRRRRDGAGRPRLGRRRLDAHPRRVLRAGRPEAQPRAHLARAGPRRHLPRQRRRPHPHRAETAPLLDVLAGYELGDATWAPPPAEPATTAARRDPGRLRIASPPRRARRRADPGGLRGMQETGGCSP